MDKLEFENRLIDLVYEYTGMNVNRTMMQNLTITASVDTYPVIDMTMIVVDDEETDTKITWRQILE